MNVEERLSDLSDLGEMLPSVDMTVRATITAGNDEELLSSTFVAWVQKNGLRNDCDAEELLAVERLTPKQYQWLRTFCDLWDLTID